MSDPIGNLVSITWWRNLFQKTGRGFGWGCAVIFGLPLVIGFGWNQFSGRNAQNTGAAVRDALLMKVNGEPVTMGDFYAISQRAQMGTPGESFARTSGSIIYNLVQQTVLTQDAKKAGVKASDADIDKALQDFKLQKVGPKATDADLENYLFEAQHLSVAEFREQIAKSYIGKALLDDTKKKTVVTEEEARNQSAEVRLTTVLIAIASPTRPDPKAFPDADAKKKTEDLLDQVKAGKLDITAAAKASSSDFNARQGGDTNFLPEYKSQFQSMGLPASMADKMGNIGYGKEFDEAVHKAKPGDYIGVFKSSGFQPGYLFAKLVDRRNNLPKDFAPQKAVDALKAERAQQALIKRIEDETKAANVAFDPERIEQKTYYDYFLFAKAEQDRAMAAGDPTAATTSEDALNKQKDAVFAEVEALYKKDSNNTTAAILILDSLKVKMMDPKTPPAEQAKARERLLPLYQTIIKTSEGDQYAYRFGLAETLRDKKQFAEAYKNYHMVSRLLNSDTPTDMKSMQDAKSVRERLVLGLKSVASPEAPTAEAEAVQEQAKIQELDNNILMAKIKEAEDKKRQDEERKKQLEQMKSQAHPPAGGITPGPTTPEGFGKSLDLGPGSKKSITLPAGKATEGTPAGSKSPAGAPAPGGNAPAVPSGKTPPPVSGPGR